MRGRWVVGQIGWVNEEVGDSERVGGQLDRSVGD